MTDDVRRVSTAAFGRGIPGATAQGVCIPAGRALMFTTGVIARDADGHIVAPGDIRAQTHRVFENLSALLAEANATLADVVSATIYLRDMNELGVVREVRAGYWPADPPVLTTVEVARLVSDDVRIELTAVVALPA